MTLPAQLPIFVSVGALAIIVGMIVAGVREDRRIRRQILAQRERRLRDIESALAAWTEAPVTYAFTHPSGYVAGVLRTIH